MGFLSSLFGIKGSQPKTSTVVQAQKLPEEIAPFVKEILGEAQDLYKHQIERGYDPYTGETIAPLTAEEEAAMAGLSGLVGTTTPFLEESLGTYRTGGEKFTPEVAEEYMSPYQRAVTDIEKREAERTFERDTMPRFEASGVAAGGLSGLGTRAGVQAAELQRNQNLLLADIEAKGQQQAFQDARMGFESQKAREQQMAANVGRIGPAMFQAGLAEQGALQTVGEQKRDLGQSALDEAYFRFLEEKQFPQQTLSDYSGMVYGSPGAGIPSQTTTTTELPGAPSTGQQLMGLGMSGLNLFGMGGGFNPGGFNPANIWAKKEGGPVIGRARGGQTGIWNDANAEYKETPSGLQLMMKGSDGRYYTKGGEDQRGLYYPEEVREEIEVESKDEITDGPPPPSQPLPLSQQSPPPASPLAPTPLYQDPAGMRIPSGKEFGMNAFNVDQKKIDDLLSQMPWLQNRLGSIVPGRKPSVPLTDDPIRKSPPIISTPEENTETNRQQAQIAANLFNRAMPVSSPKTTTYLDRIEYDPGFAGAVADEGVVTIDGGAVDYLGFKHGGGLSQLANGGPVIYRQMEGGLQLPNVPRPTLPSDVMANIRQRREAMRNIKDPVKRRIAEREIVTLSGDPSRKLGRPQDIATTTGKGIEAIEGATIGAAGKVAAESEKGISGVEKVLKEAAAARGQTVGELQSELARVQKGIPPKGIVGTAKATEEAPTIATMLTRIADDTSGGIREHKVSQAARESENIKLLNRLKLEGIDKKSEGEVKVAESRKEAGEKKVGTITAAQVKKVGLENKAKLKGVMDTHQLHDEIHAWPKKLQDEFYNIVKQEKDLEKLNAEIKKLKAEAGKLDAEAAAEGKGVVIKPAVYNAVREAFDKMTESKFLITELDDGTRQLRFLGGKPLDSNTRSDVNKVLAEAYKKIQDKVEIGDVTTFIQKEFDKIIVPAGRKKKTEGEKKTYPPYTKGMKLLVDKIYQTKQGPLRYTGKSGAEWEAIE